MQKAFLPIVIVAAAMFAYAPIMIANAPYESTMLLVQKIFYFHMAAWAASVCAVTICGVSSAMFLFKGSKRADQISVASAELTVLFVGFGFISGTLWGRKAWGTWWAGDARVTMALVAELIFLSYLLVRKYGGPGAEKLSAAMGIFGAATAPFVYKSVDWWRTIHPKTSVLMTLNETEGGAIMWDAVMFCSVAFVLLFAAMMTARLRLESLRGDLDRMYLAAEE
jgi:heme exporter protein C